MKLKEFSSYAEYVRVQTEVNKQKLSNIWVTDRELVALAKHISEKIANPSFGICHGVRNGYEVKVLRQLLGCEVIGTEISDTAIQFENVIQWDFHEVKAEWIGNVDFIYSNSWDHSYDPELLLRRWTNCLTPNGLCYLEWSRNHMPKSVYGADCFGIHFGEMLLWLKGKYNVVATLRINRGSPLQQPVRWLKDCLQPVKLIAISR